MSEALLGLFNILFLALITLGVVVHAHETDRSKLFWGAVTFFLGVVGAVIYAIYCVFDGR